MGRVQFRVKGGGQIEAIELPDGYELQWGGEYEAQQDANVAVFTFLPLGVALNLETLLASVFMLTGMCVLLRRWSFRSDAAMFGAVILSFSGFSLLFVQTNQL